MSRLKPLKKKIRLPTVHKLKHKSNNSKCKNSSGHGLQSSENQSVLIDESKPSLIQESKKEINNQLKSQIIKKSELNEPSPSLPVQTDSLVSEKTIYFEGLPFTSNESEVRSFFNDCGKILSLRLPKWHDTGRLRGYGHIEFAVKDSVNKAFELDGLELPHRISFNSLFRLRLFEYWTLY